MGATANWAPLSLIIVAAAAAASQPEATEFRTSKNGQFIADHYPPEALKRGEQGRVAFELTIERDGLLAACEVTESSGFATLDRETCELLALYAEVEPGVDANGKRVRSKRSGYIVWKLPSQSIALATPTDTMMPKPDPIICKRSPAPGSLIKKVRRCMTQSEWKMQERTEREFLEERQGRGFCGDHGCQ